MPTTRRKRMNNNNYWTHERKLCADKIYTAHDYHNMEKHTQQFQSKYKKIRTQHTFSTTRARARFQFSSSNIFFPFVCKIVPLFMCRLFVFFAFAFRRYSLISRKELLNRHLTNEQKKQLNNEMKCLWINLN